MKPETVNEWQPKNMSDKTDNREKKVMNLTFDLNQEP